MVLAILDDFVKKHQQYTYNELETVFYKEIQGGVGVIGRYREEEEKYKNVKHKRHFWDNPISLHNGDKIVVSTEWGKGNINKFIQKVKELGYIVE